MRAGHDTQRHLCRRELHVHDGVLGLPVDIKHAPEARKVRFDLFTSKALVHVGNGYLSAMLSEKHSR